MLKQWRTGGGGVEQGNTPIYKHIFKSYCHITVIYQTMNLIYQALYLKDSPPPPIFREVSATASFDWRMRVEKTLVQTLASQLSSSFDQSFSCLIINYFHSTCACSSGSVSSLCLTNSLDTVDFTPPAPPFVRRLLRRTLVTSSS